jgi:hypothetical protein
MKKKSTLIIITILVVAIISLGAGYVIAETTGNKINVAYSLKTGDMRILTDPNNYNPNKEATVSWNVQGIPGEPGAGFNNLASATNNIRGYIKGVDCLYPSVEVGFSSILYDSSHYYSNSEVPPTPDSNPSPSASVNITSGKALVILTSGIHAGEGGWVSFAISGSTTRNGDFHQALGAPAGYCQTSSATFVATGLTNGPNTFTLVYNSGYTPTGDFFPEYIISSFYDRSIIVIPLP